MKNFKPQHPMNTANLDTSRFLHYAITNDVTRSHHIIIITNMYCQTLAFYKKLYDYAKTDFPSLSENAIQCVQVIKSSHKLQNTAIRFSISTNKIPPNYFITSSKDFLANADLTLN